MSCSLDLLLDLCSLAGAVAQVVQLCPTNLAICLMLTVLGFNFVGDGLRDAFDPKMKR